MQGLLGAPLPRLAASRYSGGSCAVNLGPVTDPRLHRHPLGVRAWLRASKEGLFRGPSVHTLGFWAILSCDVVELGWGGARGAARPRLVEGCLEQCAAFQT